MKPDERRVQILQVLREKGYVRVDELSETLGVSEMTVRRDLGDLQEMGLVLRQYGGASLLPDRGEAEWPLELRRQDHADEKNWIGRTAATLVQDGDVAIVDGGSTALQVVRHLTQSHLTVVTNSFPVIIELSTQYNIQLIALGGVLHVDNQTFIGPLTVEALHSINANVAILGTTCLSLNKGLSIRTFEEAAVQRAKIEAADRAILVMDSSKMHTHTLTTVAPLEKIHTLVTDEGLADEDREAIEARGVHVIIASSVEASQ